MSSAIFQGLETVFNVETTTYEVIPAKPVIDSDEKVDVNTDYVEDELKTSITEITDAAEKVLALAEISEQPRAYEVYATLQRTKIDALKELSQLRKKAGPSTVNNTQINAPQGININDVLKAIQNNK